MNVGYHHESGVIIGGLHDDNPDTSYPQQLPPYKPPPSTHTIDASVGEQTCQPSQSINRLKSQGFCCPTESNTFVKLVNAHQCLITGLLFMGFIGILTLLWTSAVRHQQILPVTPVKRDSQSETPLNIILNSNDRNTNENANVPIPYNKKTGLRLPSEVVVESSHNLRSVTQVTHSVTVSRLTSPAIPSPAGLSINCCSSVRHLSIQGPISQEWLHYLLKSFQNLETLTLDIDQVVSEWGEVNRENLDKVMLVSLHAIYATNSNSSPILEWRFGLEMPDLKIMSISKSTFSLMAFKKLQAFLSGSQGSIEGIEISESYISPECDVTELQFPKLRNMKITRVKSLAGV